MATTSKNSYSNSSDTALDISFLLVILLFFGIGLVQVYSSSFVFATETRGDGLFFVKKQGLFTLLSLAALIFFSLIPWRVIHKYGIGMFAFATFSLLLTMIPGIGKKAGGAARWVDLGILRFEPSELLKISLPVAMAYVLTRKWNEDKLLDFGLKAMAILTPLPILLFQPDFGSVALYSMVMFGLLFMFGLRWQFILSIVLVSIPTFYFLVMNVPYRKARLLSFLDPWADPTKGGFQVIQSLLSFSSGGLFGVGLGQGQGKLFFLPEAHTDFTLAVFGEELGFVGYIVLMLFYGFLIFRGFGIGFNVRDVYARCIALGLSLLFALQIFVNIGVVLGMLPPKGLTLPFLSYGGSHLLMMGILFGILLNIERTFLRRN